MNVVQRFSAAFISLGRSSILIKPLGRSHRALDVERADVLPMLFQQRYQEIDGQVDVLNQLVLGHVHVANGDVEAQHLKIKCS